MEKERFSRLICGGVDDQVKKKQWLFSSSLESVLYFTGSLTAMEGPRGTT